MRYDLAKSQIMIMYELWWWCVRYMLLYSKFRVRDLDSSLPIIPIRSYILEP